MKDSPSIVMEYISCFKNTGVNNANKQLQGADASQGTMGEDDALLLQ